jgi:hypothetical protein
MENKMVRVPFDVEMANKITNGEVNGNIVTRNGRNARVICFDAHSDDNIVALIEDEKGVEYPKSYVSDGMTLLTGECDCDLMLEIPEYMTFKDGDIATLGWKSDNGEFCEWITILKSVEVDEINILTEDYVTFCLKCDEENYFPIDFDCTSDGAKWIRKPTETEKQKLIDALKESKDPEAKECLKMLGIEIKPKCEFSPKDWVLCYSDGWNLCQFSHTKFRDIDNKLMYVTVGGIAYDQCIPYNEQTAHLLGTTDNWEE